MAKVAIVEDVPSLADMYRFKFEQAGFEVVVAYNGEEGLQKITDFRPDLVLLDLMLPEMSGDQVLARVRAYDWGKGIRVLILTNIGEDEAPALLRTLNVDRYIVKADYTPAQVVDIVKEVLGQPQA